MRSLRRWLWRFWVRNEDEGGGALPFEGGEVEVRGENVKFNICK